MTTQFRIAKTDENDAARVQAKKMLKEPTLGKRAVLGELGNKVLKNIDIGKGKGGISLKQIDSSLKQTDSSFKHVKARVDSHWKKNDSNATVLPAGKPVTRSDSLKSLHNAGLNAAVRQSGTAKTTASVKPKVVHVTKGAEIKKVKIVNLKREESRLSRRSLNKLKLIRKQSDSSSSTSAESSSQDDVCTQEYDSPDTHSHKLLEGIENIDINDDWNPMLVSDYVNDIYKYLNELEDAFSLKENFLEGHKQINHKMRTILIDWINEVHYQFKLEIDTYHMTVSIIDRYLQLVTDTQKKDLQLVGVTAMFIASKYEELFPPDISDFAYITDDTYKKRQILDMEKKMVKVLDFHLGKPLPTHFLRRFSKAAKVVEKHHSAGKYLIELASIDYSTAHFKPSEIAAAALYISLYLFPLENCSGQKVWTKTLEYYTKYTVESLVPIVQRLAKLVKNVPNMKVQAVYTKYHSSKFDKISTQPEFQGTAINKLIEGQLAP
ncbi:G2/mitotic-specific cyclin-B [Topomyia yanbarensis]|uniref:G2/mitotic-specific cyclin-B n=1 Tax=Topomyia yanbarensis TaxID=2498891 RepID=UPI00273B2DA6|nr:G2/mitotic-specific cyclin-B [Topomyia yanbarensis]